MIDEKVTHRLKLYILMSSKGYLSMSMMVSILEGLAVGTQNTWKDIVKEHERLACLIDTEASEIHFDAVMTNETK